MDCYEGQLDDEQCGFRKGSDYVSYVRVRRDESEWSHEINGRED